MTTPTPYTVTQDDVQDLIRVMENAGRAPSASWFDVAHAVLRGLHNRGIVDYSIPRVTRDSVVQENQRLELVVQGLNLQLNECRFRLAECETQLITGGSGIAIVRSQ